MGEIKSTLDLVLEKTKGLTFSTEEKEEHKQKEIENRIKGMVQKYQDGILSFDRLKIDYTGLKRDFGISHDNTLITEIARRLEPTRDNRQLLELMRDCCSIEPAEFENIIEDFRKAHLAAEKNGMERLKDLLAQQHGISGSAVIPNLDSDEQWRREISEMRAGFEERLNQMTARLSVV